MQVNLIETRKTRRARQDNLRRDVRLIIILSALAFALIWLGGCTIQIDVGVYNVPPAEEPI